MKRLILQIDVSLENPFTGMKRFKRFDDLYEISKHQARKFAEQWDCDYICIDHCDFLPDKHPTYQRFAMYEMDYDQILYLDCDAVILDCCPNIFEMFGECFSAVRDTDWDKGTEKTEKYRKELIEVYGAEKDYRPFCAGVMLISRDFLNATRDHWRNYLNSFDSNKGHHDQGMMNKLVVEVFGGQYNELNEDWGAWYHQGKYIDHLGGYFRKAKFDVVKYIKKNKLEDFYERYQNKE
jgi:lipopolysaccharide biosynthesis glycosyltransferase